MGQGCSPKPALGSITKWDEERKGKEEGGKEDRREGRGEEKQDERSWVLDGG